MPAATLPPAGRRAWLLVLVWALAVPVAAALAVLALRLAGADSSAAVLSAGEAAALATASPAVPVASPSPAPTPSADVPVVVERRVPGAVLGLKCEQAAPVLVWSVPDPGWRVEQVESQVGGLRVKLEADEAEVRVTITCVAGAPEVVAAERDDD